MNDFRALPPGAGAPDLGSLSAADAGPGDSPFVIFQKIHRLLRGRYRYAIGFGAMGAAAGLVAGYMSTKPKYESVGLIHIRPMQHVVLYQTPENQMNPMFTSYVQTQANYLQEARVISQAVRSEAWKGLGRGADPEDIEAFKDALTVVTTSQQPEWIRIKFADRDPKAAKIAVEQVIQAYEEIYGKNEMMATPARMTMLNTEKRITESAINELRKDITGVINSDYPTNDLAPLHKASLERLAEIEAALAQLELAVGQAKSFEAAHAAAPKDAPEPDIELTIGQIAAVDEQMRMLVAGRASSQAALDTLNTQFKQGHRSVIAATGRLAAAQKQVEDYARRWVNQNGNIVPGAAVAIPRSPEAILAMQTQVKDFTERRDKAKAIAQDLNLRLQKIQGVEKEIATKSLYLADVERRLTQLNTESNTSIGGASGRIEIVSTGEEPFRPAFDSRKKLAAAGFMVGGGIPVAIVLLLGLLDRRYRYSDEAGSGRIRPTLLGILPYLPEHLRDPEQAAIAAHCVHQIRTLLQIGGADHERRVFAVTSPTSGDGKTSLSLSLGLSFAASGSETCLIDFDMIGGGLTSAMQAKTDDGLMDAINRGELNGHIKPTGFPRLSIIPIGRDDAQDISRLSPGLVRRIIAEAKEKFDIVVIDTGPILGSIEAAMVTAAADGVILTLGRGQARPQAERAMEHLASVGATLMGVVFNRAQPGDFRKAVTSASVRSVPNQQGFRATEMPALPALGPMASTLAGNFRSQNGNQDDT